MTRPLLLALIAPLAACAQSPAPASAPQPAPAAAAPAKTGAATPAAPAASEPEPATPAPPRAAPAGKHTYSQCHVDGPYIAMTWDDGPHATQTPRLLDMLKERKIKGTFFVVGKCVAEYPEIAKRIVDEGHEIASHSWSHPQLSSMSEAGVRDQIERTHQAIKQATGIETTLFRPPYGAFTLRQRNWAHSVYGYRTILWDVDTLDWKHRSAARTESIALSSTHSGSIILQHDIHKTTIDAMPGTLDGLAAKGFKFVTVSDLIAMDKPAPVKPQATPAPKPAAAKAPAKAEAANTR